MKELFMPKKFQASTLATIEQANSIIIEYQRQGYMLTLRQLYYQFVARDLIANSQREYNKLGRTVSDARLAGLIDWTAIEDRVRNLHRYEHWDSASEIIADAVGWFSTDKWRDQDYYVEVWIEKDALVGVIEGVCQALEVPHFACRGYNSQSEMWQAGRRFKDATARGKQPLIIHLGDHDPSGLDMSRDLRDRMGLFISADAMIKRISLNMDQVEHYNPPPNFAKITDTRAKNYIKRYGQHSWELDALEPQIISDMVKTKILEYRDDGQWKLSVNRQEAIRSELDMVKANFQSQGI